MKKLSTLADKNSFQAWINRIAVNRCKNFLKGKRTVSLDEEMENDYPEIPYENMLPDDYVTDKAKTVIMFYFNNISVVDIAEEMGCPTGTVTYRLNASRAIIKKEVLKYEKDNDDRLHSIVPIPFLTKFLRAQAESIEIPNIQIPNINPVPTSTPQAPTGSGAANAASAGAKGVLSSVAAKVTAGVIAVALIGSGAVFIATRNNTDDSTANAGNNSSYSSSSSNMNEATNGESSSGNSELEDPNTARLIDYTLLNEEYNAVFDKLSHINCTYNGDGFFDFGDEYYKFNLETGELTSLVEIRNNQADNVYLYKGHYYYAEKDTFYCCDTNGNVVKSYQYNIAPESYGELHLRDCIQETETYHNINSWLIYCVNISNNEFSTMWIEVADDFQSETITSGERTDLSVKRILTGKYIINVDGTAVDITTNEEYPDFNYIYKYFGGDSELTVIDGNKMCSAPRRVDGTFDTSNSLIIELPEEYKTYYGYYYVSQLDKDHVLVSYPGQPVLLYNLLTGDKITLNLV